MSQAIRTRIYTTVSFMKRLDEYSTLADHSMNAIVIDAVEEYIKNHKENPKRIQKARPKYMNKKDI